MYLESNKITDIQFYVNQCDWFTNNTNLSHEASVKRICWYLQGTKDKGMVVNPPKKIVVDCYNDEYFAGTWRHESIQDIGMNFW